MVPHLESKKARNKVAATAPAGGAGSERSPRGAPKWLAEWVFERTGRVAVAVWPCPCPRLLLQSVPFLVVHPRRVEVLPPPVRHRPLDLRDARADSRRGAGEWVRGLSADGPQDELAGYGPALRLNSREESSG